MIKVRFLDPEMGDNQILLEPEQVAEYIEENKSRIGVAKWGDDEVMTLLDKTGIREQLEAKDGEELTIYPLISGG